MCCVHRGSLVFSWQHSSEDQTEQTLSNSKKVAHLEQLIIWAKRESCDAVRVIDQNAAAAAHHCISSALLSLISGFTSQPQCYYKVLFFPPVQHNDTYSLNDRNEELRTIPGFRRSKGLHAHNTSFKSLN